MPKPGVMLYFNMRPSRRLPDRERLQLYDAILDYSQTGAVPELSGASAIIWEYIQPTLEADNARYEATKEKRAKAGALGGMARGKNEKQSEANQANAYGTIYEEANQANTIQFNTEQYSTVQYNSVPEDLADKPPARQKFSPPGIQDVQAYCAEKGYTLEAERFVDYYTSIGWKVGKNPMKDWKAALRNWAKKEAPQPAPPEDDHCGYVLAPLEDPWEVAMRERRKQGV